MSILRPLALAAVALSLAGCVSLLPKAKPAQLYRFGYAQAVTPASAPGGPPAQAVLEKGQVSFDAGAATDRILTVEGDSAAYIAGARWISPAPVLFDEALARAFQAPGAPAMAVRGALGHPPYVLNLDVQTFEARYDQGPAAPPEAVVQIRAVLLRGDTRTVVADQLITSQVRAGDNRIGPIVTAYDGAVQDALGKLTTWVGQAAR
jgi:cholesterol transport system auxiliary component